MYMYSMLDIYTHTFAYIYIHIYMAGLFIPDLLMAKTFVKWAVHLPATFLENHLRIVSIHVILPSQSCYRRGNRGSTSRTPVSSFRLKAVKCLSVHSTNISELHPHASHWARPGKGNTPPPHPGRCEVTFAPGTHPWNEMRHVWVGVSVTQENCNEEEVRNRKSFLRTVSAGRVRDYFLRKDEKAAQGVEKRY